MAEKHQSVRQVHTWPGAFHPSRRFARASQLSKEEAEMEMRDYARRHPYAFRTLTTMMLGQEFTSNNEQMALLAHNIPVVALFREGMKAI